MSTSEDETENAVPDYLNAPDDELPDFLTEPDADPADDTTNEDSTDGATSEDTTDSDDVTDTDDTAGSTDATDDDDDSEADADDDESESAETESEEDDETDGDSSDEDETSTEKDETDETDETSSSAQDQLDLLFSPFKANGKQMQVNSIEDVRTLMQMGANYDKKMAGLKPSLRIVKMLDKNNLLDESKISYLIDLDKKDPNAISKLLKDSGVDPLEVDVDKGKDYKPNTYAVDDAEVELDEVLDGIRDTPTFQDTVEIISDKWDGPSKQVLFENPNIISVINDHVANGIYEQITNVIESERMMGRLKGVSDVRAYQLVGDEMKARGLFDEAPATSAKKPPKSAAEKAKSKSRKKAASPTKSSPSKAIDNNYDPLSMSDDEFDKVSGNFT